MHCITYIHTHLQVLHTMYYIHSFESFAIKQIDKIYKVLWVLGILQRSIQYFIRLNDVGTLPGKHSHSFPLKQWCWNDVPQTPKSCVDSFNAELMYVWISGRTRGELSSSCSSWQELFSVQPEYFLHVPLHGTPLWDLLLHRLYSLQSPGISNSQQSGVGNCSDQIRMLLRQLSTMIPSRGIISSGF